MRNAIVMQRLLDGRVWIAKLHNVGSGSQRVVGVATLTKEDVLNLAGALSRIHDGWSFNERFETKPESVL